MAQADAVLSCEEHRLLSEVAVRHNHRLLTVVKGTSGDDLLDCLHADQPRTAFRLYAVVPAGAADFLDRDAQVKYKSFYYGRSERTYHGSRQ